MSQHAHGGALVRRLEASRQLLAEARARSTALREELAVARSVVTGLRRQVEGRDATIKQLEATRDAALSQAAELVEALAQACATPPTVVLERDVYRAALADIEAVLHRLGTDCGCAHAALAGVSDDQ